VLTFISGTIDQDIRTTTNGTCLVYGSWADSAVTAKSNSLFVTLNYETAEMQMSLDLATLRTGIDSIDRLLNFKNDQKISFLGELTTGFIKTKQHPIQNFKVIGYLSDQSGKNYVVGDGQLEHISEDLYSCILSISFTIDIEEIGWKSKFPNLDDELRIDIHQTVLKRSG